jgi:hypothetical protein
MASRQHHRVYLTHEQYTRLLAVDEEWLGSEHYMGLAWFWNYEYRFHLRDASALKRVEVHDTLLATGLPLDGESPEHLAIIEDICGILAADSGLVA